MKLDKERLKEAIRNNENVADMIFKGVIKYLQQPLLSIFVKAMIRDNWDVVEYYLASPQNLRREILRYHRDIELYNLLHSREGISWLNRNCKEAYIKLYNYTWS